MTGFIIVFEILFLILIASLSFGQQTPQYYLSNHLSSQASNLQVDDRRHLQRPPDWRQSTTLISSKFYENTHLPNFVNSSEKSQNIIYLPNLNESVENHQRRTGRTRRSPRTDRYDNDDNATLGGLALVASSTGLSSSATTTTTTTTASVPTWPQPQDEETSRRPVASPNDAQSSAELCYLASGGSSLTLTVNEATPVGSLIGTIDVNGDPSLEGGNVDLLDGLDQAASGSGGTFSSSSDSSSAATSQRQNRRLLGRRDTSDAAAEGVTPIAAALSSPFYALVGSTVATTTTTSSPAATTTTTTTNANQQQVQATAAAAVRVQPGTKNLILARPLDKESPEGESSLLVNVRCRARQRNQSAAAAADQQHRNNQSTTTTTTTTATNRRQTRTRQSVDATYTTIPIRLIVTDANDHAPEFVVAAAGSSGSLPYVINISETTPVGSIASRDILAIDKDSAGPHSTIHYRVLEPADADNSGGGVPAKSPASLFAFTNPLEPTLWLTGPLDYESLPSPSFALTIVAQDQGEPEPLQTSAQVQVNVLDFDDQNPKFLDEKYTLVMDEIQASLVGQNLRVLPRNLRAEDGDRGINAPILYSFDLSSSSSTELADSSAGVGVARQPLVEFNDAPAASNSRALDPALNIEQYLHLNPTSGELRLIRQWPSGPASLPLTLVIRATQADNRDRYALTTLTITRAAAGNSVAGGSSPSNFNSQVAPLVLATTSDARQQAQGGQRQADGHTRATKRGIEFVQEHVTVQVPEDTPASEKIARVRAQHLALGGASNVQNSQLGTNDPEIAIQKQRLMQLVASSSPPSSPQLGASQTTANNPRPINYQILDDQTDQFSINGLGEILLKRPLDYELRQEFRFRVLATYTRYSDICHVQVQVTNVNDNKPKFTQSQYSFHLTESRLRSNSIGQVVAHDADLNDTIQYSILPAATGSLQEQCTRLFEISHTGQLSLRAGTRALNTSQCQLIVQASDSLATASGNQRHQQQARVNIYVAPQLIGRSLNLNALITAHDHQQQQQQLQPGDHEAKLFNSRSLQAEGVSTTNWRGQKFVTTSGKEHAQLAAESSTIASNTNYHQPAPPSSQRSSMATVVASLQHMMKSVNFFEMPMSSALLLSVLLTFLVCLLLIVIISMSVHVYRRRSKSSSRVRHLTAAARMRHAHLVAAAAAAAASSGAGTGSSNAGSSPYGSSTSSSSSSSSPTTTSIASPGPATHYQQRPRGGVANRKSPTAQPSAASLADRSSTMAPISTIPHKKVGVSPSANTSPTSTSGALNKSSSPNRGQKKSPPPLPPLDLNNKHEQLGQLKISISSGEELNCRSNHLLSTNSDHLSQAKPTAAAPAATTTKLNPLYLETPLAVASLKSPLGSYRSAISSTDDSTSSLANCGHYSVNGTLELNPRGPSTGAHQQKHATKLVRPSGGGGDKLERAINDLVTRQEMPANEKNRKKLRQQNHQTTSVGEQQQQQEELEQLTQGKPGVRAYRPLPMMNSLVRPLRQARPLAVGGGRGGGGGGGNKVAPFEQLLSSHQQRIEQQEAAEQRHQRATSTSAAAGLMALVRESVHLGGGSGGGGGGGSGGDHGPTPSAGGNPQIRWPSESIPHKIKKLTWDDEMSCCDNESMLGMDLNNNSMQEQAGHDDDDDDEQRAPPVSEQNKFLFSLNSHMQLPSLNGQQQQQPLSQHYTAPSMDTDPSLTLNLESHHHQNHQNNCLDYTIVESSQFHVDSLASVDMRSIMSPRGYGQLDTVDRHSANNNNNNNLRPHSTTSQSNATTFKLNQNYQDLKLMTTAVL